MRRLFFVPALLLMLARVEAQEPTFTSNANLVIIDVSVKDRSGKVIPDLKQSDFTLLEDGKPQQISVFEFQKLEGDNALPPVPAVKPVVSVSSSTPAPKRATCHRAGARDPLSGPAPRRHAFRLQHDGDSGTGPRAGSRPQIHPRADQARRCGGDHDAGTGPLKIVQDFTDRQGSSGRSGQRVSDRRGERTGGRSRQRRRQHDGRRYRDGVQRRRNRIQHLQYGQASWPRWNPPPRCWRLSRRRKR